VSSVTEWDEIYKVNGRLIVENDTKIFGESITLHLV